MPSKVKNIMANSSGSQTNQVGNQTDLVVEPNPFFF